MLLTRIVLKNFGVYRDENVFDLSCTDEKPIVLIGGTNGAGKTTLFESVMLCLYGMSTFGKKITRKSYEQYLSKKIHRYLGSAVSADHASIVVEFKFFHDGRIVEYQVDRTWRNDDGKIIEELIIKKRHNDDEEFVSLDTVEKSHWQSFVEDLVPRGIARLFFFDGEKIVQMAEENNEDITIKSSFNSLLGLDLVEQLKSDLQVNLMRNLSGDKDARTEFEKYAGEKETVQNEIGLLTESRAQKESEINQIQKEIDEIDGKIARIGGEFAVKREELKAKQSLYKMRLESVSKNIQELCGTALPFSLIPKELEELAKQLKNDETILKQNFEKEILSSNMNEIKQSIQLENFWKQFNFDNSTKEKLISKIFSVLDEKIESRSREQVGVFNFSLKDAEKILSIIEESNGPILERLEKETLEYNEAVEQLRLIDVALINAPKDDEIGPLISKLNSLHQKVGMLEAEISHIDQQIASKSAYIKHLVVKIREALGKQFKNEKAQEKAELTEKVLNVLDEYSEKLKIKKLHLLEEYLLEGIKTLMHKTDFINKVTIDKETFEISLFNADGNKIPKDLLSKGEQQMFATAVLWALAKTSGRPLPFMIDTPLARLDVEHRHNLVEIFFPTASHQVVIFSTDSEIDEKYYKKLYPYITRSYALEYLPNKGKTKVHQRYFWNELGEKIVAV
ncbi:MAG TPA: DNA sulfur modification protein DndD [Candidatus Nitrosotenuis sp.]|nr:DNA sulfur modification protein DndD [Candidatus Nitrosotenuis sp.]